MSIWSLPLRRWRKPPRSRRTAWLREPRRLGAEPLEQRRLLTVMATLVGTDLSVIISGADTATITSDPSTHDVKVNGVDPFGGPALSSSLTIINVTPDATATDTVDLTGVGTSADFSGLNTLTVNAGAATDVTLLSGSYDTTGGQTYDETVTLGANTTLASTGSGNITFGSTVNGAFSLTANTAGATSFGGAVGGTTALTSITTDAPGSTALNGGGVTTTGAQTYNDAVTLGANTTLASRNLIAVSRPPDARAFQTLQPVPPLPSSSSRT